MNGNPIGKSGIRALQRVSCTSSGLKRNIGLQGCLVSVSTSIGYSYESMIVKKDKEIKRV